MITNIKSRIKRLESDICPPNKKYGVLIYGYRSNCLDSPTGRNNYMKGGKLVGYISSVLEWANGKLARMISLNSEEGQRTLKQLGYKAVNVEN